MITTTASQYYNRGDASHTPISPLARLRTGGPFADFERDPQRPCSGGAGDPPIMGASL